MTQMTKLERVIAEHLGANFKQTAPEELQARLDEITPALLTDARLRPYDIIDHLAVVYHTTVKDYASKPNNKNIIPELINFMAFLPDGGHIIDMGCAYGRDTLFMACRNEAFRESLMQRKSATNETIIEKYGKPPRKSLRVIGIDNALGMLEYAQTMMLDIAAQYGRYVFEYPPMFFRSDMHTLLALASFEGMFDGVWSCTALFTHTPTEMMHLAMRSVASLLKRDGIFFTSYTNGTAEGEGNHRFLVSSTGHIKYFSQPDSKEIARMANAAGLSLIAESFRDMVRPNAPVKKRLFVSQFYRKR